MTLSNQAQNISDSINGSGSVSSLERTIGQHLDSQIQLARSRVEELCINKAKLEALGMLNLSHHELQRFINSYA